jgi:hypothetical protein
MSIGWHIVQQEEAEKAVLQYRIDRLRRETAKKQRILRARQGMGRLVEIRPRGGGVRRISFEQAMSRIERTHPQTAARLRATRGNS